MFFWLRPWVEVLFPNRCVYCGELISQGKCCPKCQEGLPWVAAGPMVTGKEELPRLYSALIYGGQVPQGISRFKFGGQYPLAEYFAGLLLQCQGTFLKEEGIDVVTAVPMYRSKRRRRGYNQAELLAREVAKGLCMEYRPLLVKAKNNQIQHSLGMEERAKNVQGVYQAVNREEIEGKRILLVDDIFTTGATMGECAKTLTDSGAAVVVGASLAWVPR